jgi:hypothetical protein
VVKTTVRPADPDHPVCRGVRPFEVRDELYYKIRFRERDPRLKPILLAPIEGVPGDQVVAWAVERADGGRGFGFTGGHFFDNWYNDDFRKLVLNAIAWTAKLEVPPRGIESEPPRPEPQDRRPDELVLAEGRFGEALDARVAPAVVDPNPALREPPLTVECWAKLFSKKGFNVLVASDPKTSSRHWELYTCAGSGRLAAYLPGYEPSEIVSEADVCDGRWRHVALAFDGKMVRLYADGKQVKEQAVKPKAGLQPVDGMLTVGVALAPGQRIGCDGLIDDLRVSRGLRAIQGVPQAELPLDPPTLLLLRFNKADQFSADPAWTPRPASGNAASFEKETDADWIDARFRVMDTGPYQNATFEHPSWKGKALVYKGTAVRVGDQGEAAVLFDRCQMRYAAGWTGAYLVHSDKRFGLLDTPRPAGEIVFATAPGLGWANPDGNWNDPHPPTAPLPADWAKFRGLHLHGKHAVLEYTVGGVAVLDSPWVETRDGLTLLTRTLEVGPSEKPLTLRVCDTPGEGGGGAVGDVSWAARRHEDLWTAAALKRSDLSVSVNLSASGFIEVRLAPAKQARRFKVLIWRGKDAPDLHGFQAAIKETPPPADVAAWLKPGPDRWPALVTRGEVGKDDAPYVIDTLTVPYDNPFRALFFITALDFLPNGDVAVCTCHGDVWIVQGVDEKLDKLTWKRFATGLYQPLGLKVVDGKIIVLERGQLTRLHDLDGDGLADFYEDLNSDWHTGGGQHSYDTCLETDPQGNFFFFKTGDPETPTGGCLLRVSRDGKETSVFATGFRHPIGLGMSPDGVVSGADQEGNWMPATRLDLYQKGGFYGDMRTHHRARPPAIYDPPLLWLPREIDNSAGGQVWAPERGFGPLGGRMLHLSYGRCKMFLVLPQQVGDVRQAGAVDLGLFFLSGVKSGRFRPQDGHLYVAGLKGWQTAARRDGCLQRVRYTGKPFNLPVGLSVHADGVRLTFNRPLDPRTAAEPERYHVAQWNYHWSAEYGSPRFSVARPGEVGQDDVPVLGVTLEPDGRSVFLKLARVQPVMQMQIGYRLLTADGQPLLGSVYNTIHKADAARGK